MKWKLSHNAIENAGAKLPKLAEKYFQAGRKAADKKNTPKQLHRFRIQTKRFRYSLELFGPIYGPTLDRHIASLRGIQDALGKVSDYQTIQEMIAGDEKLEADLHKSRERKMKEFREEWKKFDSEGQLQRWKAYLTRTHAVRKRATTTASRPNKAVQAPGS
jgi:CHAD domain-containing protein